MDKLVKKISKCSEYIAIFLTFALLVTMFLQIFSRKVLNQSLSWTDEFAAFMLVWIALFGSVTVLYEGKHLKIDIFSNIRNSWRYMIKLLAHIVTLVFVLSLVIYGIPMVEKTLAVFTISLKVSKGIIYSAMPVTAFFMAIIVINNIKDDFLSLIRRNKEEEIK